LVAGPLGAVVARVVALLGAPGVGLELFFEAEVL
jgi:gas vesicle protein